MARKRKSKRPAAPPNKPPQAPLGLTSSVQDEPSNQPEPTTPIPESVKNDPDPKIIPVRKYWNTLSVEKRRSFLEVSFHDLRAHYASQDDVVALDILSEALSHAENNKTLKFWACHCCNLKFKDGKSYEAHLPKDIGSLVENLKEILPEKVDQGSVDLILSGSWKPIDPHAALKMIKDGVGHQSVKSNIDGSLSEGWPLAKDHQRTKHLKNIQDMFQFLLKHNCLADIHVKTVIEYAMNKFLDLEEGLRLQDDVHEHVPVKLQDCVCLLGVDELLYVFCILKDFSISCELDKDSEKITSGDDEQGVDTPAREILQGISFSNDLNFLILNESLFTVGPDGIVDSVLSKDGQQETTDFLSWIFHSSSPDGKLELWTDMREDRGRQGMEILQKLKEEFNHLWSLCTIKFKHQCNSMALDNLENLCIQEYIQSTRSVDYPARSYKAVLWKRHKELVERKHDAAFINVERNAIVTVLLDCKDSNVTFSNKEDLKIQESDKIVLKVIDNKRLHFSLQMSRIDSRIMQKVVAMEQLERELESISIFDYQKILLFLVKMFLKARLEDLAEKNEKEDLGIVAEALLELKLETKSNVNTGGDDSKATLKKKDYRGVKDRKDVSRDKEILSHQETEEQVTLLGATDVNKRKSGLVATESVDNMKQVEYEVLQYLGRKRIEAKQKFLAEKCKVGSGTLAESVEKTANPGPSNQG